ncbi:P-loop NTPase fold protein [Shewanella frigidimarina]|uniref:KAP NTPase domain-containing protein n=1 Tax=Shewanella frigidimarina TaxID=56812 RepID=A0A119CZE5_SHEFR|nr:P-loop NTPase fold protein [Shewanella frigidimarina]KVX01235.1 hypothetical protein AWJ07_18550 [Shewanella frigidimarina]
MATTRTLCLVGKRWFSVFLCSVVAILTVTLLAQFTWISQGYLSFATLISGLPFKLQCMVSFLAGLAISIFLTKLYVYSKNRVFGFNLKYPPITLSVVFIILFSAVILLFQDTSNPLFHSDYFCQSIVQLAICFMGMSVNNIYAIFCKIMRFFVRNRTKTNQREKIEPNDEQMKSWTDSDLEKWLNDDSPIESKEDLDDNYQFYVERIKERIIHNENTSIALCGAFGVGKSSIINCLVQELENTDIGGIKFIHCNVDCWGVNTNDITQFVLSHIIDTVNREIDMSAFKKLPAHYKEALKTGSNSIKILNIFLDEHTNPTKELGSLNDVLTSCNLRVLVTLQDLDRNNGAKDNLNNLAALLDRLRPLESFSFVIPMEYKSEYSDIIVKVTDYREDVIPSNFTRQIQNSLACFYKRLFNQKFRLLTDPSVLDYQELSKKNPFRSHGEINKSVIQINQLIPSYRVLKDVLRRVNSMWNVSGLLGEVDLVTLMLIVTLRETKPSLFDLLLENYDGLMGNLNWIRLEALGTKNNSSGNSNQVDVSKLVDDICKGNAFDKAIIINLFNLVPASGTQALHVNKNHASPTEQTIINRSDNVSYLKRILFEKVPTNEVRDQDVIKDLLMAKEGYIDSLLTKLLSQSNYFASYDRFRCVLLSKSESTYESIFKQAVESPSGSNGISRDWLYKAFFEALTKENRVSLTTWLLDNFLQNDIVMFFEYINNNESNNQHKIKCILLDDENNAIISAAVNNLEKFTGKSFYKMGEILSPFYNMGGILSPLDSTKKKRYFGDLVEALINRESCISLQYATLYFKHGYLDLNIFKKIHSTIEKFDDSDFSPDIENINSEFKTRAEVLERLLRIIADATANSV